MPYSPLFMGNVPSWVILPGLSEYNKALELIESTALKVINKLVKNTIYLVEHDDVYTAGTNYKPSELLNSKNIPVVYTNRGGKFTYHGPGQRIIYPIIDISHIKDIKLYIHILEKWIINTLYIIGIKAYTIQNKVGIWVDNNGQRAKIGSIGIRVKKWVAYHGIAVNISTDLSKFIGIIPCGLKEPVTSIKNLGVDIKMDYFDEILKSKFPLLDLIVD